MHKIAFIFCQIPDILFPENEAHLYHLQQYSRIHYKVYGVPYGHRCQPEMWHNMMLNDLRHHDDYDDGLLKFFLQQLLR